MCRAKGVPRLSTVAKGYYEHVLWSRHAVEAAVRYVLENPLRAGLAKRVGEYRFSGDYHP